MHSEIEAFFANDVREFTRQLSEFAGQLGDTQAARKDDHLRALTNAIEHTMKACARIERVIGDDKPLLEEVRRRFRELIAEWFDRSWFMQRAKTKPFGYPGDYVLLCGIYDEQPKSLGIGGYLDLYFLDRALARGVRARARAAREFLLSEISRRQGDVSILNVACGPCREYLEGFHTMENRRVRVTCVDADQRALDYVGSHVVGVRPDLPEIDCFCYNALRMRSARNNVRKFGARDIIYSIGLCDYLPNRVLVPMISGLRDSLNEDGVLYIAFKDASRYVNTVYPWLVDWHFLQRTEQDCRRLFREAGINGDSLQITRDETGIIMNCVARVQRPASIRVDVPPAREWSAGRPNVGASVRAEEAVTQHTG
jgi:SAM-dependent methyltransferase